MQCSGWGLVIAMLLGSSSVALAEDVKPKPGVEMTLEQRRCSVIDCTTANKLPPRRVTPEPPSIWRKFDPRRPDRLLRLHYELMAKLDASKRALQKVDVQLAACEARER